MLLVGLALVAGCQHLQNREAIAALLPEDLHLDSVVCNESGGQTRITVEEELIRLGAHLGKDGKLQDELGKPIYFFQLKCGWGTPPSEEMVQRCRAEEESCLQELRKTYAVIRWRSPIKPCGAAIP
jgi:hypothetical protein